MSLISRRDGEVEKKRQVARTLCDGDNCRIHGEVALMTTDLEIRCSMIEIAATRRNGTEILSRTCLSSQTRPNVGQKGIDAKSIQIA